jgi:hypothetical protein
MNPYSLIQVLSSSNLTLFFSLPFRPAGKRNAFYNGHIALALNGTVYQIYNPGLLKTDFLFSIMPVSAWLFDEGETWVDRDPSSPCFRHVHLYKTSETKRTAVYAAGIQASQAIVESVSRKFHDEDERFRCGAVRYDFIRNNCSSIIADALVRCGVLRPGPGNLVPALLFKKFAADKISRREISLGKIAVHDRKRFALHRFCIGLWGTNPQDLMDKWLERRIA